MTPERLAEIRMIQVMRRMTGTVSIQSCIKEIDELLGEVERLTKREEDRKQEEYNRKVEDGLRS